MAGCGRYEQTVEYGRSFRTEALIAEGRLDVSAAKTCIRGDERSAEGPAKMLHARTARSFRHDHRLERCYRPNSARGHGCFGKSAQGLLQFPPGHHSPF